MLPPLPRAFSSMVRWFGSMSSSSRNIRSMYSVMLAAAFAPTGSCDDALSCSRGLEQEEASARSSTVNDAANLLAAVLMTFLLIRIRNA